MVGGRLVLLESPLHVFLLNLSTVAKKPPNFSLTHCHISLCSRYNFVYKFMWETKITLFFYYNEEF